MARLMNIGFGNVVNTAKMVAVVSPDAAPVKRMVQNARQIGKVIEDHIILSALQPETLVKRFHCNADELKGETDEL